MCKVLSVPYTQASTWLNNIESSNRRRWSVEEEDGLRRAVQRLGPGSWKEIRESEPVLTNRTAAQIKDKVQCSECTSISTSHDYLAAS